MKFSIKGFFSKCDQIRSFLFPVSEDSRGKESLSISPVPVPLVSETLAHYPSDYCNEFNSAHS